MGGKTVRLMWALVQGELSTYNLCTEETKLGWNICSRKGGYFAMKYTQPHTLTCCFLCGGWDELGMGTRDAERFPFPAPLEQQRKQPRKARKLG